MAEKRDPCEWSWKPVPTFNLDLEIAGKRLVVDVNGADREAVALSLARLADAVMGDQRHLFWRWDDGAESDLDGNTILEPSDGTA